MYLTSVSIFRSIPSSFEVKPKVQQHCLHNWSEPMSVAKLFHSVTFILRSKIPFNPLYSSSIPRLIPHYFHYSQKSNDSKFIRFTSDKRRSPRYSPISFKVHPSPGTFIPVYTSPVVFQARRCSALNSAPLSRPPCALRLAHVPPTEIMKSETQGTYSEPLSCRMTSRFALCSRCPRGRRLVKVASRMMYRVDDNTALASPPPFSC